MQAKLTIPLLCFDMDGCIECREDDSEYISGSIKITTLQELEKSCEIIFVSPSPYYPKNENGTPMFEIEAEQETNDIRYKNLQNALKKYQDKHNTTPIIRLYISDNEDYDQAEKAGFIYVDSEAFAKSFL